MRGEIMIDVEKELEFLDPLDQVLLLCICSKPTTQRDIQLKAVVLSDILGVPLDAVPYTYPYSETITEKLSDERNSIFFVKKGRVYVLTANGKIAQEILMKKFDRAISDFSGFVNALHRMKKKELLALVRHLFPELFTAKNVEEV